MRKRLSILGVLTLAVAASVVMFTRPADAAVGLHVSGRTIVEANGQVFTMRGVNHPHVWYTGQTSSFAAIKAAGANTVRVVLGTGKRWGPSNDVPAVIDLCKTNKLICVLEVHDTTGYGEEGAAASLDEAANYWISQKANLVGQENYVVINIGNEPIGNTNAAQWTAATAAAIQKMRSNGFEHLLMVDAPNWGQDWQNVMRDTGQTVLDADTRKNTVLSIHMYAVYPTAASVIAYFDAIAAKGWPLVVGEFGWKFAASEVDHEAILSEAQKRGLGWLAWSWSGNTDPILDMTTNFNPAQLTTFGERIVNGADGLRATAKEATIFGGTQTTPPRTTPPITTPPVTTPPVTTPPVTTPPVTTPPVTTPPVTTPPVGGKACTATYTVVSSWPGGFQGEVRVTAGNAAISGWSVGWTFANGQTVNNAWSATVTSSGSAVTARNAGYNGSVGAGASTTFGFLGSWNGTNGVPAAVSCTAS